MDEYGDAARGTAQVAAERVAWLLAALADGGRRDLPGALLWIDSINRAPMTANELSWALIEADHLGVLERVTDRPILSGTGAQCAASIAEGSPIHAVRTITSRIAKLIDDAGRATPTAAERKHALDLAKTAVAAAEASTHRRTASRAGTGS